MKEQEVSEGDTRSSNRSVIPELAEGSPADSKHTPLPPDPIEVAQPHTVATKQKKVPPHRQNFFPIPKTSYINIRNLTHKLAIHKISFINSAIRQCHFSFTSALTIHKISFINIAIWPCIFSFACAIIIQPIPFIDIAI